MVNVQHDCISGSCKITRTKRVRQEREDTSELAAEVSHSQNQSYVLNLAQMRDAATLQHLSLPLPSLGARNDIIHRAAAEEIERRRHVHQKEKQTPRSHTPDPAISSRTRQSSADHRMITLNAGESVLGLGESSLRRTALISSCQAERVLPASLPHSTSLR
ncbi:hypothetical protein PYCCODRAFT_340641 [Trametes coccinea BRFM310]|uniref:Uncharacterized protein n=1 Tax=Trametes coccinea (strain BRFM310) TaxID=1353009 RepID=A0A1Y2J2X4_TRAC3|nr:hypothetical protein PYCCODRAFT_340641 [Trametes coccinea BRFM310]